jgi:hypothetical protein
MLFVSLLAAGCGPSVEEQIDKLETRAAFDRCVTKLKNEATEELRRESRGQKPFGDGDPYPEIKRICGEVPK